MKTTFNKIESKVFTDPDSGAEIYPYEVNGEICPYVLHESHIAKQFAGHVLILKDLDFAINCLKNLQENKVTDKEVRTSLLFSSLFTYMKCFTSGSERGTHLHDDLFKPTLPKYLALHKEIDEFRDQYLAHASTKTYESSNIALFLNPDISKKELITLSVAAKYATDKDDHLIDYIELMEKVKELVSKRMKGRMEALKAEVKGIDIEELYKNSKTPNRKDFKDIEVGKYKEE